MDNFSRPVKWLQDGKPEVKNPGAAITILMSSSANLHFKGCPEFLFCARTRLEDQHKTMNMYGLLMFTFLIFSFVEGRNLIDCAVRSCSFRMGIRACLGLSSIMLFKNIGGVVMWR